MKQVHNEILLIFIIMLTAVSCTFRPEEQIINIIENNYANLYVNDERHKREVVSNLRSYLKKQNINDRNINEINARLHEINDGHIVLFDERKDKNTRFKSGLVFIPGSNNVESCGDCSPALPEDKYEILKINNLSVKEYLETQKFLVAASTPWGRKHRVMRLLEVRSSIEPFVLKLKSSNGKSVSTKLNWKKVVAQSPVCVSGERLKADVFKLNIYELWCDDPTVESAWSRKQIFQNFKKQFDETTSQIGAGDKIIIDLRENGGGGDLEVEYVLNAFNEKSVFMYHYRYLRSTHPGKMKWLVKLWPFKLNPWGPDEYQYTNILNRPKKTFFDNTLITLISPGCFSSCETIASSLKMEKRSEILGTRTHGGSGEPQAFPIRGTPFSINIPTCVTWQENGKLYEGSGVYPNRHLEQGFHVNFDNVLASAIDLAQQDRRFQVSQTR